MTSVFLGLDISLWTSRVAPVNHTMLNRFQIHAAPVSSVYHQCATVSEWISALAGRPC